MALPDPRDAKTREEYLGMLKAIREADPRGPRPESEVEKAMRECTDAAVLAGDPQLQFRYHLLGLCKDSSTVFTNAHLRLAKQLRARGANLIPEEADEPQTRSSAPARRRR